MTDQNILRYQEFAGDLRLILKVPEGKSTLLHAQRLMDQLEVLGKLRSCMEAYIMTVGTPQRVIVDTMISLLAEYNRCVLFNPDQETPIS